MNKKQRKSLSKAFTVAKEYLEDGSKEDSVNHLKTLYICFALSRANDDNKINYSSYSGARNIIHERLNKYDSVEDYLKYEVKVPKKLRSKKSVQDFRHRWLDSLSEEFSK